MFEALIFSSLLSAGLVEIAMKQTKRRFWSGNNRFRLMLTLELAVMLPAVALIYVNFNHLNSIERDKKVEAAIHGDFQYVLAVSEKKINQKAYTMAEETRSVLPVAGHRYGGKR